MEYRKEGMMGGDNIPRRPPIWECVCGCRRFRKVNWDGSDAPVKVKMLKNVRKAPATHINWESNTYQGARPRDRFLAICNDGIMTQDEKWLKNYHAVMEYMEANKRNPSKYDITVRCLYTWIKHQRKLLNAGQLKPERVEMFEKLQDLAEEYRHVNQYQ